MHHKWRGYVTLGYFKQALYINSIEFCSKYLGFWAQQGKTFFCDLFYANVESIHIKFNIGEKWDRWHFVWRLTFDSLFYIVKSWEFFNSSICFSHHLTCFSHAQRFIFYFFSMITTNSCVADRQPVFRLQKQILGCWSITRDFDRETGTWRIQVPRFCERRRTKEEKQQ